jgi:hypothetical protein
MVEAVSKLSIVFKILAQKRSTLRNIPDIFRIDRFANTKILDTRGGKTISKKGDTFFLTFYNERICIKSITLAFIHN